jgi:two-component system, cell cycle sensor histidine kinase and response regulator CckA
MLGAPARRGANRLWYFGPVTHRLPVSVSVEALLLNAVQQAVIATDQHGVITYWNQHAHALFGWTAAEAIGRPIVDVTPSEASRDQALAIMQEHAKGKSWSGEFPVRRKDGSRFTAFVVNSPILGADGSLTGIVGVSTDVSERRALEAQLAQRSRLESIGRLAGGIAHDFNNLLTIMLANLSTALERPVDPTHDHLLRETFDAAQRAAALTRQLLAFGRKRQVRARVTEVTVAVRDLVSMFRRVVPETIDLELSASSEACWVGIEASEVDQIVMNLVLNARDAMPDGGRLFVSVGPDPTAPGSTIALRVTDTGLGVPAEVK